MESTNKELAKLRGRIRSKRRGKRILKTGCSLWYNIYLVFLVVILLFMGYSYASRFYGQYTDLKAENQRLRSQIYQLQTHPKLEDPAFPRWDDVK